MDSFNGLTYEINEISETTAPTDLSELKRTLFAISYDTKKVLSSDNQL